MAPEVISGGGHDARADVWSLGITLIELVDGTPVRCPTRTTAAAGTRTMAVGLPAVKSNERCSDALRDSRTRPCATPSRP
eukprot:4164963-Prymnesium_polylepis.1